MSAYTKMLETYVKQTHEPIALDNLEPTSLRQRLKIIRSLSTPSEISLDEINRFAVNQHAALVKNYNDLIANQKRLLAANPAITTTQTTHPINHLLSAASLFVSDIVHANEAYRFSGAAVKSLHKIWHALKRTLRKPLLLYTDVDCRITRSLPPRADIRLKTRRKIKRSLDELLLKMASFALFNKI